MGKTRRKSRKNSQVRYTRLINNMTVSELAYKADIDRMHLERIESGSSPCTEQTARRLAELFGTPNEWERFVTRAIQYA